MQAAGYFISFIPVSEFWSFLEVITCQIHKFHHLNYYAVVLKKTILEPRGFD